VLSSGLLVVHDTGRGGEDDLSERTGGEQQVDPVLDCTLEKSRGQEWLKKLTGIDTDVESGGDDTSLVQSTVELDDDLSSSVVVNDLELSDVACC
jgi:hypothetical protein